MEVRFLETHGDIFLGGKNHGKKHRPSAGLTIKWNEKDERAEMTWNGEVGWVFTGNIALLVPGKAVELPKNEHATESLAGRKKAQVATPMDHVFRGEGHGKVKQ